MCPYSCLWEQKKNQSGLSQTGESNRGVNACKQELCTGNRGQTIQSEDPAFLGLMLFVPQQAGRRSPLPHLSHSLETSTAQTARPLLGFDFSDAFSARGWFHRAAVSLTDTRLNWTSSSWQDNMLNHNLCTHGEDAYTEVTVGWTRAGGKMYTRCHFSSTHLGEKMYLLFPNLSTPKLAEGLIR